METTLPASVSRALQSVDQFATEGHEKWFDLCYKFLAWEREAILPAQSEISPQGRAEHRKALLYLLKVTEFMFGVAPENSDLQTLRWRLNESWQLTCNQPDSEKASKLREMMAAAFPA